MDVAAIVYLNADCASEAERFAVQFAIPCIDGTLQAGAKPKQLKQFLLSLDVVSPDSLVFILDGAGLRLQTTDAEGLAVRVDFLAAEVAYRRLHGGGRSQMIAKAVGLRPKVFPRVLDATAGLGGDAFVLASLGCAVQMIERVPAVRAMLEDGLHRARQDASVAEVLGRMQLLEADSLTYLDGLVEEAQPDVIYLDPMFPERGKSALVKKEMRVFHRLVGSDPDADRLLEAALEKARYRVVVKRPRIAPALAGREPSHVLEGKRNRYDIYTLSKMPEGLNA